MSDRPDLGQLQQWMQAVLVNPLGDASTPPSAVLPAAFQQQPVESLIRSSARLSARAHLAIYQRSYLWRLRDCMAGQFPALQSALGAKLFEHFADQYLQATPSRSYTLADLGLGLPEWLEATRPDRDQEHREDWPDFLIELARFELAVNEMFDAHEPHASAAPTAPDVLCLAPLLRLFAHRFPVASWYRAATSGGRPKLPLPEASHCLLLRRQFRLRIFELQPTQYDLLCALQVGTPLSEALADIQAAHQIAPRELARVWPIWRSRWLELGVLQQAAPDQAGG